VQVLEPVWLVHLRVVQQEPLQQVALRVLVQQEPQALLIQRVVPFLSRVPLHLCLGWNNYCRGNSRQQRSPAQRSDKPTYCRSFGLGGPCGSQRVACFRWDDQTLSHDR
jgi:hypothetical protein